MTYKSGVITLVLLLCAIGAVTGWKYFKYIKSDPAFCSLCHLTEEGYASWERSEHFTLTCQQCHKMTVIEGNKLLLGFYVKGDKEVKQDHGRKSPWESCITCHNREAAQGSITFRNSYGHARHVFMKSISCDNCHRGKLHDMTVDSVNCRTCHTDKLVHGMGTVGMVCLNCHNFTSKEKNFISSKRCFGCHDNVPAKGVMSALACHKCHHPHTKLRIESSDCLGTCHSSEAKVGQHGLHMEGKASLECLDCHKPHEWVVEEKNASGLCDKCHKLKDPVSFIYYPTEPLVKP